MRTPTSEAPGATGLLVDDRMGTQILLHPGETFIIGRNGDLAFSDNPYLHRRFVLLSFHDDLWWITNVGTHLPLRVVDERTGATTVLTSEASVVIVSDRLLLVFEAGPTIYEIALTLANPPRPPAAVEHRGRDLTARPGRMNSEQILLLVAMAEPLLRYPGTGLDRIPSIQAVADRLGWPASKTNRKLDYLCQRLADDGVSGLVGDGRGLASNRRTRLVEYALDTRMITAESLVDLDEHLARTPS